MISKPPELGHQTAEEWIRDFLAYFERVRFEFVRLRDVQYDTITSQGGRIVKTTRIDSTPYTVLRTDHEVFADTDTADIVVNLPAGVAGTTYRIVNVGTSGNQAQVTPNGTELLIGVNSAFNVLDGEALIVTYESTEGWY